MSEWAYVAIAYGVVWGSLALYAVFMARRVAQARHVARVMREGLRARSEPEGDSVVCDVPPAP